MAKCLCCYKELSAGEHDFHKLCARKMFGKDVAPRLAYSHKELDELARLVVVSRTTVTGVQAKLSMDLEHDADGNPSRLTIVGLMGRYILKPQAERFERLPELEDLTMHLADIAKIATVPHCLIRFEDGELNYITRRIDRTADGYKLKMEDMCQVSGRLTEQKYQGSYEMIAALIRKYSSAPILNLVNFWEQVVFSWIVGNADMHLKNFSLFCPKRDGQYLLAPTYDQLSTVIAMPEDTEELALSLNGWKKKLMRADFEEAMLNSDLKEKTIRNIFQKFINAEEQWYACIDKSFVTEEMKRQYKALIHNRLTILK